MRLCRHNAKIMLIMIIVKTMVQLHYAHSADESHGVRISPQCPWRVVGGDKQGACSNETANTEVPCHSR